MMTFNNNSTKRAEFTFRPGDIFLVRDWQGETMTHRAINLGLSFFGNKNPEFVHAGIAIGPRDTIEMSGDGIGKFSIDDIHGQMVTVFRYRNPRVSQLAAELAYNLEGSDIEHTYPDLKSNQARLKYALARAAQSSWNALSALPAIQRNELEQLVHSFDFTGDGDIANKMYCSEFVIVLYELSRLILNGNNDTPAPLNCNLHYTNPSQLYHHLCSQGMWEKIDLRIIKQGEHITLVPVCATPLQPNGDEKALDMHTYKFN